MFSYCTLVCITLAHVLFSQFYSSAHLMVNLQQSEVLQSACLYVCLFVCLCVRWLISIRSSAIPEAPRDYLLCQFKSWQLLHSYTNKKLCDCRGIARRAMLVNSCYVSRGMGVRKGWVEVLRGHLRSLKIAPFDRTHTNSY